MARNEQTRISTLVFFDLEATGLKAVAKQPRITEISLVAVNREHLADFAANRGNPTDLKTHPRVVDKLLLCFFPFKRTVDYAATEISGLSNDNLFHQKDFDEDAHSLVTLFLQRLAPPVCLVAHNGNEFDFPLLKAEFFRLGKDMPEEVLCVDSLEALRWLDDQPAVPHTGGDGGTRTEVRRNGGLPVPVFYNEQQLANNITPELQSLQESWKKEPPPAPHAKKHAPRTNQCEAEEKDVLTVRKKLFEVEETKACDRAHCPGTPVSDAVRERIEGKQDHRVKKRLFADEGSTVKENGTSNEEQQRPSLNSMDCNPGELSDPDDRRSKTPPAEKCSETQLYWRSDSPADELTPDAFSEGEEDPWDDGVSDDALLEAVMHIEDPEGHVTDENHSSNCDIRPTEQENMRFEEWKPTKRPKLSYKLAEVHKRMVGTDFGNAHNAEADCFALLRIFQRCFLSTEEWINGNATSFGKVHPMYRVKSANKPDCLGRGVFPSQR